MVNFLVMTTGMGDFFAVEGEDEVSRSRDWEAGVF
jgi:hypothetical protein